MSVMALWLSTLGGTAGGSGAVVALASFEVLDFSGGSSSAGYQLTSAGDVIAITDTIGPLDRGDWVSPKGAAPGSYECRADIVSGSLDGGSSATGSWLALTSTRTWTISRGSPGVSDCILTMQIRLAGVVLTTAEITLTAEVAV